MLEFLRSSVGGWVAKIFIGLLVLSFAVWGVSDTFTGFSRQPLAKVGDREISAEYFESAYRTQMRLISRQFGQPLNNKTARALGVDSQVLSQLVSASALDNHAVDLGLGLTDEHVAQGIAQTPSFQDVSGNFDRIRFRQVLRDVNMSEQFYLQDQKLSRIRSQLTSSITAPTMVPSPLIRMQYVFENEKVNLRSFKVTNASLPKLKTPEQKALEKFYETRKDQFKSPEYRKSNFILLTPATLADRVKLTDKEIKEAFESRKGNYGTPEKREILQISFPSEKAATKALKGVKDKKEFIKLAESRGLKEKDYTLGSLVKNEMVDAKIAEAAFQLAPNTVSKPVKGNLSTVVLFVSKIIPKVEKSFEEIKPELTKSLKEERAQTLVEELHEQIEEQRASGLTLKELAEKLKLTYKFDLVTDSLTNDKNGKPVTDIGTLSGLNNAIFGSDVGIENDPLEIEGPGFIWFEVADITPAAERPLKDVQKQVEEKWLENEKLTRLFKISKEIVDKLNNNEPMKKIAAQYKAKINEEKELKRGAQPKGIPGTVVTQAFFLGKGKYSSARTDDGDGRVIFQVTDVIQPGIASKDEEKKIRTSLMQQLQTDTLESYVTGLRNKYKVHVDQKQINRIIGAP